MIETLGGLNPILQALLATLFTWEVTVLGATTVFFRKDFNRHLLNGMLGFAAGVMIAASYWSLLAPAIAMSSGGQRFSFGWGVSMADGQTAPASASRPAPGPS